MPIAVGTTIDDVFAHVAEPEFYRRNAFRLTGLPVDATAVAIRQAAQRLRIIASVGGEYLIGPTQPLLQVPAPDPESIEEALRRLRDPVQRFIDEFFWFWPSPTVLDEAHAALAGGDHARAAELWGRRAGGDVSPAGPGDIEPAAGTHVDGLIARHNLAVLAHVRALEDEDEAAAASPGGAWDTAFARWRALLDDDAFWIHLHERTDAIRDPRLATMAARLRSNLPQLLLTINATLTIRAAEAGRSDIAIARSAIMGRSGFDAALVTRVCTHTLAPTAARIRSLCQTGENQAEADPTSGDHIAGHLLDRARTQLAVVDVLLAFWQPTREGLHDEVARSVLHCVVRYANETGDEPGCIGLLEDAQSIAATNDVRTLIGDALKRAKKSLKIAALAGHYEVCWFCLKRSPVESASINVPMYGEVRRTPAPDHHLHLQWNNEIVSIPRCARCQHRQVSRSWRAAAIAVPVARVLIRIAIIFGAIVLGSYLGELYPFSWWQLAPLALWFVPIPVVFRAAKRYATANKDDTLNFPVVQERIKQGWAIGSRPREAL